jgi:hypothetical protein
LLRRTLRIVCKVAAINNKTAALEVNQATRESTIDKFKFNCEYLVIGTPSASVKRAATVTVPGVITFAGSASCILDKGSILTSVIPAI